MKHPPYNVPKWATPDEFYLMRHNGVLYDGVYPYKCNAPPVVGKRFFSGGNFWVIESVGTEPSGHVCGWAVIE